MDYTTLSLADVATELEAIARDAQTTFGGLDERQLNWRPDATQWSVAQCLEHLVITNGLMSSTAEGVLNDERPRTIRQRLPVLPGLFGRMLIRSQSPDGRKVKTVAKAQPAASAIGGDVVQRFVEQERQAATRVRAIDEYQAARAIMISPFLPVIIYSVLDGWRLFAAHGRRHVEQARRVMLSPGFPNA